MAEYIEREVALAAIAEEEKNYDFDTRDVLSGLYIAEDCISKMTAADVVPVRYGRWIQTRITRYNGDKPYTQFAHNCSLCNWLNKKKKGWNTKFCPNCGAKMDEEAL